MARINAADAQAWAEATKLPFASLDPGLIAQIEAQLIGKFSTAFDTSTWVDTTNTPELVKSVIAMTYVSWYYNRTYSEDQENLNDYAVWLLGQANALMMGIIDGSIILPGVVVPSVGTPAFYPNDASSALCPTFEDPSLGDSSFSMGQRF
jgi:hypothetical protein